MKMALIGMPWFWAHMPSIQLAIVKDILTQSQVESDVFEFYADFADLIGTDLYGAIANTGTFIGERLFTQFYYPEYLAESLTDIPHLLFNEMEVERDIVRFATPLVEHFLERCLQEIRRSNYDAVCFTLTAQQVGASMALAKLMRPLMPGVPFIVGGAACAGDMGRAVLEVCQEFSIAVHGEAEVSLPQIVEGLRGDRAWETIGGISARTDAGDIFSTEAPRIYSFSKNRNRLNYDSYFDRLKALPALNSQPAWIPFESSRGCWYGEKSQCTFCGLNEIIKYRQRDTSELFDELASYEASYNRVTFFSVDLIMPRSFFTDFLPQVSRSGKDWTIFYEVKSNMRRSEVRLLSDAGVRWIQPGIESLSDNVLRLMRKGVTSAHNIQTLRLSTEMGVTVSWNLICNFPQETDRDYREMEAIFPLLFHLDPPSGLAPFEVHRFSPFHEQPLQHGVELDGPHKAYRNVFPVDNDLLTRLVYRFEYNLLKPSSSSLTAAHADLNRKVDEWKRARARDARLQIAHSASGTSSIFDDRLDGPPKSYTLSYEATRLILFLDEMRPLVRLESQFENAESTAYQEIGGSTQFARLLDRLSDLGLVLRISGVALSLPTIVEGDLEKLDGLCHSKEMA